MLEKVSSNKVAGGELTKYKFDSASLSLPTQFNVFIPASAASGPVPVLFYLAGLTCTEDTGAQKGGLFNTAADEGIALVFPDTSPRGAGVEGEDDDWQLGTGAGFYINADNPKWSKHYRMYDLVVDELPKVLKEADLGLVRGVRSSDTRTFPAGPSPATRWAGTAHSPSTSRTPGSSSPRARLRLSGAWCVLTHRSNPSVVPWGQGAFGAYLNARTRSNPPAEWLAHDASHLLAASSAPKGSLKLLVDVGTADQFLKAGQLAPEALQRANEDRGGKELELRMQDGYDHSYYFVRRGRLC